MAYPVVALYQMDAMLQKLSSIDTRIELTNTLLNTVNATLSDIYDRQEHTKIDSFVDVRVMDITGDIPVPASELGLLVAWVGAPTVSVSGTVDAHLYSKSAASGSWLPNGALNVAGVYYTAEGTQYVGDGAGQLALPLCGQSGNKYDNADTNYAVLTNAGILIDSSSDWHQASVSSAAASVNGNTTKVPSWP